MDFITSLISGIKTLIYYSLFISYQIGRFIVSASKEGFGFALECFNHAATISSIILEDFNYFAKDASSALSLVFTFLSNTVLSTYNICMNLIIGIYSCMELMFIIITGGAGSVAVAVRGFLTTLRLLMVNIKQFIVLFGSGIWFAITFIPLCIVYVITMVTYYTGSVMQEFRDIIIKICNNICQVCLETYNFIIDVPLESAVGLIAALSIVYLLVQFHVVLINYICECLRYIFLAMHTYYSDIKQRVFEACRNNLNIFRNTVTSRRQEFRRYAVQERQVVEHDVDEDAGRFCVACQERLKCVLMLPCRHVCLCTECNVKFRSANNICPLCRTEIDKTMKIFI